MIKQVVNMFDKRLFFSTILLTIVFVITQHATLPFSIDTGLRLSVIADKDNSMLYYYFWVAIIEEIIKFSYIIVKKLTNSEIKAKDYFVGPYTFATIEVLVYLYINKSPFIWLGRLTATLFHIGTGLIVGHQSINEFGEFRWLGFIKGLCLAALVHWVYNSILHFLGTHIIAFLIGVTVILLTISGLLVWNDKWTHIKGAYTDESFTGFFDSHIMFLNYIIILILFVSSIGMP